MRSMFILGTSMSNPAAECNSVARYAGVPSYILRTTMSSFLSRVDSSIKPSVLGNSVL